MKISKNEYISIFNKIESYLTNGLKFNEDHSSYFIPEHLHQLKKHLSIYLNIEEDYDDDTAFESLQVIKRLYYTLDEIKKMNYKINVDQTINSLLPFLDEVEAYCSFYYSKSNKLNNLKIIYICNNLQFPIIIGCQRPVQNTFLKRYIDCRDKQTILVNSDCFDLYIINPDNENQQIRIPVSLSSNKEIQMYSLKIKNNQIQLDFNEYF